ncbi:type II toxin-antitoxin system RelE/ParE family toxin [Pseudomonas lalucatii]|uniref:Type II toxin-antitoxin system RelE/ParE family toxin n=1 Tax=Pseudomonas lalucatii TaxID=1424203 RepID=A0ABS5PXX7_9PSED|nr:type II toxin-antitoxin system RelE/ParE family toxin [Pseudomonas lalucatii]MBS7661355.1 type II toxin-antitoxin system RelE/ParE family toxin [Pseudomonas lalucatii]
MSKTIKVAYATTAEESLVSQIHHLTPYHGVQRAQTKLVELIKTLEQRLKTHPLAAPVCQQAALLGITHYRELNLDEYRILYQYDEAAGLVMVALILRQRQSIEEQLINYCLLR